MSEITDVTAWEVLDSRGNPTVRARVDAKSGSGTFTVPAGASTGEHEVVERRDGGGRYGGQGVTDAVAAANDELAEVVVGRDATDQEAIDAAMVAYDGTDALAAVGANAVLAVSGAVAHAASSVAGKSLHRYIADSRGSEGSMPTPMVNVVSGGLHAEGGIEIQDVLAVPRGATTYSEALETAWDVRRAVRSLVVEAGHRPLVADEGGFAPPMAGIGEAFELVVDGIERAGYVPGDDVALAVDVAASHFYDADADTYRLESVGRTLDRGKLISLVVEWTESYPLISIEDPLAEDDWRGWARLADRLPADVQLLGDDLLVTNRDRLARATEDDVVSAVLVKPNQAGTMTRAMDVVADAKAADVAPVVSARSGETCDTTIADLAVGLDAGQIKIGSLARSERLAKYNRLLEIERTTDRRLRNPFAD
ncbi:phosphopyruvate hydratase [Halorarum halophilum]|uniref:Enolase n=1 Tax=Halorarum halophilum TaxID=2743090 RepID=A0A7D5K958_9EURY|nr:phosphopyruvate hydratase [Halobaculum halophilum]QLG28799.1 phosphopyruvate hydratase [Halobaculum halophilum]